MKVVCLAAMALSVCVATPASWGFQPPQSPIHLVTPPHPTLPHPARLDFNYRHDATIHEVELTPAGHERGLEAFLPNNAHTNTLTIGADTYRLKRFHFHYHSEHTIDSVTRQAEMHLVHLKLDGNGNEMPNERLVVGRFIHIGAAHPEIARLLAPANAYPFHLDNFNLLTLLPDLHERASWRYDGSLTTGDPNNPQEVDGAGNILKSAKWVMLQSQMTISVQQWQDLTALFPANWRAPRDATPAHNLRWDIPAPGTASLFAVAGVVALRRRRHAAA
ncbi:MAG: carbonic anhydrase family protein [Phycisphaeraceae bacterium]|nr:carbonic anhydrase family protein [Phycisphaeraceae bacterium]